MRILWLAKRDTSGQDLLAARFARFYHLPRELARRGHEVKVRLLSYRRRGPEERRDGAHYHSRDLFPDFGLGYLRATWREVRLFRPDWIVGSSDMPYVILAGVLARATGAAFAADVFDNFDAYASARVPAMRMGFRRQLRHARLVVCVSEPLARKVGREMPNGNVRWLENGVDPERFHASGRRHPRRAGPVFGYAGALSRQRGLATLLAAWPRVRRRLPQARLELAGVCADRCSSFDRLPGVRYHGCLAPGEVPAFLRALDVALVLGAPNAFGNFAFPLKLYEALACEVPVIVSEVGAMAELPFLSPRARFPADDPEALADRMVAMAERPSLPRTLVPTWAELAARLESWMQ